MLLTLRWLMGMVVVCLAGCNIVGQGKVVNQVAHPGPFEYQRRWATEFDPYSTQDRYAGPRDSTTRPRDYYQPIPETERARWVTTQPWQTPTASRW